MPVRVLKTARFGQERVYQALRIRPNSLKEIGGTGFGHGRRL